jgi:hypothetical protein
VGRFHAVERDLSAIAPVSLPLRSIGDHFVMVDMQPWGLFVCTHNAARSQMAEAVSRR